ncbi:aminotransferase class I/II-fold pyridoxal phosphate-dependent enzyme [Sagittula sp. NFXS13]|uniref:pyridoxal phosphate-dependent aminotransferase n=1 Tax=Sagittula sp. NFXS13 TaxID=2819095 RepID=UPI0032E00372
MRSSRRGNVDPFIVMDVMEAARAREAAGHRVIHMEVGQPGSAAPEPARTALAEALSHDPMGYTVALGIPALRARIAQLYGEWYNVDLDPARVVVTSGSSGGFVLAFSALFDAGDRVALGRPGYPSYRQILKAMDLQPVEVETTLENRYQPVPGDLEGVDYEGLLIASPGNPTGTMLDKPALSALHDAASARGAAFLSDEIYHGIEYDKPAVTALEISDDVVVINSFSKYFSMTGWRVGWLVVPDELVRQVERLAQNMFICAPHVSQLAALAAIDAREETEANLAVYSRNRDLMWEGLRTAGFDRIAPPDGAFYFYADVSHITQDSVSFAREILEEAGVAVTPGLDFDPVRGGGTLRFSYARGTDDIEEGLARLHAFMKRRGLAQG